jgi:hypothetical protein
MAPNINGNKRATKGTITVNRSARGRIRRAEYFEVAPGATVKEFRLDPNSSISAFQCVSISKRNVEVERWSREGTNLYRGRDRAFPSAGSVFKQKVNREDTTCENREYNGDTHHHRCDREDDSDHRQKGSSRECASQRG